MMKIKILLPLLLMMMFSGYAQSQRNQIKKHSDSLVNSTNKNQKLKDSVVLSIQQFDQLAALFQKRDDPWKAFMPSIIAIIVVIISTTGAYIIASRQLNFQAQNSESQLRSQEAQSSEQLRVAREQIAESTRNTLKQLNAHNRQGWITETRNTIAELLTQAQLLNIELQAANPDLVKQQDVHAKFTLQKNKLYILLNPKNDGHDAVLRKTDSLLQTLDKHLFASKQSNSNQSSLPFDNGSFFTQILDITKEARDVLYEEWQKIQS